jgi:predicted glycoside hydrolase/deacetylase ChbG (UPF0249 family)
MSKKLIINADDFGISRSVNQAVIDLFQRGCLSSATIMVTPETFSEAAQLAKQYKLPVGLHFNLTYLQTIARDRGDFERKYLKGEISPRLIHDELHKQYIKLLQAGLQPTHLDSHQHIHNWPGIFKVVARFAKEKNIPLRLVREKIIFNHFDRPTLKDLKVLFRKVIFYVFGIINTFTAWRLGVKTNRGLTSVFALWPRAKTVNIEHLALLLRHAGNKAEYMCHPALEAQSLQGKTSIGEVSAAEYSLMTDTRFLVMIQAQKQLISFGGL